MAFVGPIAAYLGASATTAATIASVGSAVGTFASVAGAGIGALGSIKQGKASAAAANYNSQVSANNAAIAQQNSQWAIQEGNAAVEAEKLKTRDTVGALTANQAAGGIDINSGSALDVRSSAAETGELNALNIRTNAIHKAYGYQTDATGFQAQSGLDSAQAGFDTTAGDINAGSTLLGGIGSASNNYANYLNKSSVGSI